MGITSPCLVVQYGGTSLFSKEYGPVIFARDALRFRFFAIVIAEWAIRHFPLPDFQAPLTVVLALVVLNGHFRTVSAARHEAKH